MAFMVDLTTHLSHFFKNINDILLYPFFKIFWLQRINLTTTEFIEIKFLRTKGINAIENGTGDNLKRLFRILSNHLDHNFNSQQEDWIDS